MSMHDALRFASQIAYSSKEVLRFTYDVAVRYRDLPGVYVECGVAAGAQIIAMGAGAPDKTVYAYDSFEGIPLPSNRDDQMPGICFLSETESKLLPDPGRQELKSSGATVVSLSDFVDNLCESRVLLKDLQVRKGWFEQTVKYHSEPISILRLDGDLYNSTFVCLQHLYPKCLPGAMIIIDDYGLKGCRAAVQEYFDSIGEGYLIDHFKFIEGKDSQVAYFTKP